METLQQPREVAVEMYRIQDAKFENGEGKTIRLEVYIQVT